MLLGRALCLRGKSCRLWVSSELSNPAECFWASAHSLATEPKLTQRSQRHLFAKLWILSPDMLITANTIVYIMWFKKKKNVPELLNRPYPEDNYRSWEISTDCWFQKSRPHCGPHLGGCQLRLHLPLKAPALTRLQRHQHQGRTWGLRQQWHSPVGWALDWISQTSWWPDLWG